MDVDFWASRIKSSSKHFSASYLNSGWHLNADNHEGDDDGGAFFPCPFCYVEIEISVFCSHLQEEHCFDLKNAVCPLCAVNLGKNAIEHFTVQHSHSLKRRRKSNKSTGLWTTNSTSIGKEYRDLNSYMGPNSTNEMKRDSTADPLLSTFFCNISQSNLNDNMDNRESIGPVSVTSVPQRHDEGQEQDIAERTRRSEFIQELISPLLEAVCQCIIITVSASNHWSMTYP